MALPKPHHNHSDITKKIANTEVSAIFIYYCRVIS